MAHKVFLLAFLAVIVVGLVAGDEVETDHRHPERNEDETPDDVDPEQLEYQKGSLCGYCDYCKFCKLCDRDCPCETGPKKPNCHMCKYCKFCYLCKACDTVCQPGGIIDRVTSKIFSSLPSVNTEEVNADIDGVKTWIDKSKDEL